MTAPAELVEVTKKFGTTVALDAVTLSLSEGEILGFLGPNGAGKTTALRLLLGLLHPTAGEALIGGHRAGTAPARAMTAYVPGDVALWPRLTGEETLHLLAQLHGSVDEAYRRELIEGFQIDPRKRVRSYSKGNRQKVALIAAFASRAPVLLLDEPTSGLDPLMERVFRACVSEAQARGQSILFSSHLLSEVDRLCHRVAMIREGHLITVANIDELRQHTQVIYDVVGDVGDLGTIESVASVETTDTGVRVTLNGPPGALLAELGRLNVASVKTREASLEEIFLSFYDNATHRSS